MVTARIHLDPVDADNAPLMIVIGSHTAGRVAESELEQIVARGPIVECLEAAGDVWLYRTLIVHGSARAARPASRRVLQVDYAADDLPGGLAWRGLHS